MQKSLRTLVMILKCISFVFVFCIVIKGCVAQTVITLTPDPATVVENQDLQLSCSVNDATCPTLDWLLDNSVYLTVLRSGGSCISIAGTHTDFTCLQTDASTCTYTLTRRNVQIGQNGDKWKCSASSTTSNEITLSVTAQTPCSCKCEPIAVASIVVAVIGLCFGIGAIVAIFVPIKNTLTDSKVNSTAKSPKPDTLTDSKVNSTAKSPKPALIVVILVGAGGFLEIIAIICLVVSTQTASDCCELQECEKASIGLICVGVVIAICAICLAIFRSKPGPPGIPLIQTKNNVDTSTSIHVLWKKPSSGGSKILGYSVKYQRVTVKQATAENQNKGYERLSSIDTEETIDNIKNEKHKLSNLLPGSYYQVTVIAHNINGSSNPDSKIIKTPEVSYFEIHETGKSSTRHGKSTTDSPNTPSQ